MDKKYETLWSGHRLNLFARETLSGNEVEYFADIVDKRYNLEEYGSTVLSHLKTPTNTKELGDHVHGHLVREFVALSYEIEDLEEFYNSIVYGIESDRKLSRRPSYVLKEGVMWEYRSLTITELDETFSEVRKLIMNHNEQWG